MLARSHAERETSTQMSCLERIVFISIMLKIFRVMMRQAHSGGILCFSVSKMDQNIIMSTTIYYKLRWQRVSFDDTHRNSHSHGWVCAPAPTHMSSFRFSLMKLCSLFDFKFAPFIVVVVESSLIALAFSFSGSRVRMTLWRESGYDVFCHYYCYSWNASLFDGVFYFKAFERY